MEVESLVHLLERSDHDGDIDQETELLLSSRDMLSHSEVSHIISGLESSISRISVGLNCLYF